MTNKELYELCKKFGSATLEARRKFAGLLPEVFKRRLFEKKGFSSIYEFAAKLAGMSHEQVSLVLRLERKFKDKPILRKALVEGKISPNKLVRIASIATIENQEKIFEKAKILSSRAVEVFVKDVKMCGGENEKENGFLKPLFDQKTLHVQTLKLDEDVEKELTEMQKKGIDINAFLREILQKRKTEIEQEKLEIAQKSIVGQQRSRYIPTKIKKIIRREYGTKCSIPHCQRPAKIIHHTQRFALAQTHNPHFLAPLCQAHHEIAHKIDLKYTDLATAK